MPENTVTKTVGMTFACNDDILTARLAIRKHNKKAHYRIIFHNKHTSVYTCTSHLNEIKDNGDI